MGVPNIDLKPLNMPYTSDLILTDYITLDNLATAA